MIVDRYSIHRWLDGSFNESSPVNGLNFFIQKIIELPDPPTIKVIGAALRFNDEEKHYRFRDIQEKRFDEIEHKMNNLSLGNLRKITFVLLHNNDFRDEVHFRFIKFDKLYIDTDKGVGTFDVTHESTEVKLGTLNRWYEPDNSCEKAEKELSEKVQNPKNRRVFKC